MQHTTKNTMWSESWGELWPVSPSLPTSVLSLAGLPGPRLRAASHSSARPAARSMYSSCGCLSSAQQCGPSGAEERECRHSLAQRVLHFGGKKDEEESPMKIMLALTCQCSSRSLTCCLSSFRPVRASASLSFTAISSSWRRATLVSSGSDEFLYRSSVRIIHWKIDVQGKKQYIALCLYIAQESTVLCAGLNLNLPSPCPGSCLASLWGHSETRPPSAGPGPALSPAAGRTPQSTGGLPSTTGHMCEYRQRNSATNVDVRSSLMLAFIEEKKKNTPRYFFTFHGKELAVHRQRTLTILPFNYT